MSVCKFLIIVVILISIVCLHIVLTSSCMSCGKCGLFAGGRQYVNVMKTIILPNGFLKLQLSTFA